MDGTEWSSRKLIKGIPEMLIWPASVEPMDEGSRNLWLSSLLTAADVLLPDFLDHLWHLCGGEENNLSRLKPADGNVGKCLIDFSKSISSLKNKEPSLPREERKKLEAVEAVLKSLNWYFTCLKREPSKDRMMLMADERGPGLPIIVWSASKKRKTLSKSLEFDCQGSITVLPSPSAAKGAHGTHRGTQRLRHKEVLVQCGEIKSSLADRKKAVEQLEIRLRTMQRVLQLTLGHSVVQFQLLGFIFYNKNGNPDDIVSDGDEFTSDVMIKFIELQ